MAATPVSRGVWRVSDSDSNGEGRILMIIFSQVISQALVSATNCVDPAFALHVSSRKPCKETELANLFIQISLYMYVDSNPCF